MLVFGSQYKLLDKFFIGIQINICFTKKGEQMAFGVRSLPPDATPEAFFACPFCEQIFAEEKELKKHCRHDHDIKMKNDI